MLLLVEDGDALLPQREPVGTALARRTGEGDLFPLRIPPHHIARATVEGAAIDESAGEVRGQRLAMVARVPADVTAVESVPAGGRGRWVGERSLDVDQGTAVGEALGLVDVEVVTPENVLVGDVAGEVGSIARLTKSAVAHRVDRDVAASDVVTQVSAGA